MNTSEASGCGQAGEGSETRTSVTACLRCREQKLKCGSERPVCSRCQRLDTTCSYPLPPNRRGPRTPRGPRVPDRAVRHGRQRARSSRTAMVRLYDESSSQQTPITESQRPNSIPRVSMPEHVASNVMLADSRLETPLSGAPSAHCDPEVNDAPAGLAAGGPMLSDSYPNQLRTMSPILTKPAGISDQPPLPPTALGLSLLELYFTRVYNAPLLFYKSVLFQQYLHGEVHVVLLRALFSLATLYLQPSVSNDEADATYCHVELKVLSMYHSSGLPWATAAFKEAMVLAVEKPSLMIIQALESLQLYWFGIGEPYQGSLCLALAYRACHLLGYNKKIHNEMNDWDVSLELELGRRCFWACWTSTCIVMEPEPYIKACWQEVAMLPLPGIFHSTSSGYKITIGEIMDEDWHSSVLTNGTKIADPSGAPALLMKMVGVWAKVQLLCKDSIASEVSHNIDTGEKLSQLATSFFDEAESLRSSANDKNWTSENQVMWLVHDALYYQCKISIHSMVVPVFSGIKDDPKIDLATQRKGAAAVAKHASIFRLLLEPYFSGQRHASFVPSLVGYGAFVVGIVLLVIDRSCASGTMNGFPTEMSESRSRLSSVTSILHLLDRLRVYSRALQRPWEILNSALRTHLPKYLQPHGSARLTHGQLNMRSDDLAAQTRHCDGFETPMDVSNEQLQPFTMNRSTGSEGSEVQHSFHLADTNSNDLEPPSELGASDPVTIDIPQDYDWYSFSFTEAGVAQFDGVEPSSLFQQGWQMFG